MAKQIDLELNNAGSVLLDPGTTRLGNVSNKKAKWKIKDQRIDSFRIEGKTPGSYYPFTSPPNPNFDTELELEVEDRKSPGEWEYDIIWRGKNGTGGRLDPKIAVNPTFNLFKLAMVIVVSILCIFSLTMFFKRRNQASKKKSEEHFVDR